MSDDMKQRAIEHLQESEGYILICHGKKTYFGVSGIELNVLLGLLDRFKHKMLNSEEE